MDERSLEDIRIAILDYHLLFTCGLKLLIEQNEGLVVVGGTGDIEKAVELVNHLKPDIILLGSFGNGRPYLDLIPRLLDSWPGAQLILLDGCDESPEQLQAVQNGAMGVVLKSQPPEVLIKAIRKVHAGEAWIERSKIASLLNLISRNRKPNKLDPEVERINLLSKRERQVIKLLGLMMKNQQIASQLNISEVTVRHHLTSIYSKLEVAGRLELLVFAHRYGLADLSNGNGREFSHV